eukprot:9325490-Pyramimonas_sp.AAC.1
MRHYNGYRVATSVPRGKKCWIAKRIFQAMRGLSPTEALSSVKVHPGVVAPGPASQLLLRSLCRGSDDLL